MIVSINTGQNRLRTVVQIGLSVLGLFLAVWVFSDIFTYLLISLVVATILRPLVDYISEIYIFSIKIPRLLAVIFALGVLILLISLFIKLFLPLLSYQLKLIRSVKPEMLNTQILVPIEEIEVFLIEKLKINENQGFILKEFNEVFKNILEKIDIANIINDLATVAGSLLVYLLAISFMSFFLLYEKGLFRRIIISSIPNRYFEVVITAFYKIEHLLSNYLRGILIETIVIFTFYSVIGTLLQIPYAFTIAAFAASINFIPYLGPFTGYAFGVLVVISSSFGMPDMPLSLMLIKFTSLFFAVRLLDDIFLQPFIFSKSVKAHPLEIFIVIFSGASLAGAAGMIMAIPTYTILKVTFKELQKGFRKYRSFR
jgi:predicted PurR-regulated permease PerM